MASEMLELADDDCVLPLELRLVFPVLPLAAAAPVEVGTTWFHPSRGGFDNRQQPDPAPRPLVELDLTVNDLAGQGSVDEEGLTVVAGDGGASVGHGGWSKVHGRKLNVWEMDCESLSNRCRAPATLQPMRAFHETWFWVAIFTTGPVGLWGLVLGLAKRDAPRPFLTARWVASGAMAIQVAAGLVLYGQGWRPANGFHVFYGIVIVFTFAFAYIYRIQMARRPALAYGVLLLFVMGLGLRAWSNVG